MMRNSVLEELRVKIFEDIQGGNLLQGSVEVGDT